MLARDSHRSIFRQARGRNKSYFCWQGEAIT